jgi:hypothetical protein
MNPRALRYVAGPLAFAGASMLAGALGAAEPNFPITPGQRGTAQQVAQAGVPLSELAPNAPEAYTVQAGDTLWAISKMYLTSPWRWPELWGMNLEQIRNPHLIYPGQQLVLERVGDRARLRVATSVGGDPGNTVKLSPRVRSNTLASGAIGSIPLNLIGPFLNEAVIYSTNELAAAPRVVAAEENHVSIGPGQLAYVVGDLAKATGYRLFRAPTPLVDMETRETLGYEARYVGTAEFVRPGATSTDADGRTVIVPATVAVKSVRLEVNAGDRLAPLPTRDFDAYAPHHPGGPVGGRVLSIYGEALSAGQNQIVTLNRGTRDGLERGHVLALWRAGSVARDRVDGRTVALQLPDERNGLLFVFSVFERASYALILTNNVPVFPGDTFTQP